MLNKTAITSLLLSVVMIILSLPISYTLSDTMMQRFKLRTTFDNCPGLPTPQGSLIHAGLFALIAYLILTYKHKPSPLPTHHIVKPDLKIEN